MDVGCKFIADTLRTNKKLKTLGLQRNKITDQGARLILEALEANKNIQLVNFSNNSLTENIFGNIEQLLADKKLLPQLKKIILNGNIISADKFNQKISTLKSKGIHLSLQ